MVTLTVTAGTGTPLGGPKIVTLAATVTGAPSAKTQTFLLTVTGPVPDFAIAVTATPSATVAGQNVTWNGMLTAVNGYSGSVHLVCTAGAPGTCGIVPSTLTPTAGGAGFAVTLGNATTGAFNFTIQGTDGTLTHATATESLTVGTDVTWTDTGNSSATVLAGQSATYTFSAVPVGGAAFSSAVSFACSNLPALTSCGFNPVSIGAGAGITPVTLTITTDGPNGARQLRRAAVRTAGRGEGSNSSTNAHPRILPFFTFAWVVVAGIVGLGGKTRGKLRPYVGIASVFLGLGLVAEISCGGAVGGSGPPPPPIVTVTVGLGIPSSVYPNSPGSPAQTAQFTATVTGSNNTAVTWAVTTANGGTIDSNSGLYTAPGAAAGLPTSVTITATSQADTAKSGSNHETLNTSTLPGDYGGILVTATEGTIVHSNSVTLIVQ
jgi:hypothetical protein